MLDFIRKNAQSWGVKVLFAIIVLVFVFWGVGSFRGKQKSILATVNDQELSSRTFMNTYQRRLESLRRQNKNISSEQLQEMDFKRQVFDQLVEQTLLLQEADKLGFSTSDAEISGKIKGMQPFQGEKTGAFERSRYQALLRANRMTPAQFEADLGRDMLTQKFLDSLSAVIQVKEDEARELFNYVSEKVRIDYLLFAGEDCVDQVQVSDQEISSFYQDNTNQFEEPATMQMDYLLLTPQGLAPFQEVSEEQLNTFYQDNKDQFVRPEEVKAAHILIKIPQDPSSEEEAAAQQEINRIATRIEQGEAFSELAREASQGPSASRGGDLGWFSRGSMAKPFEEAAFSLQPGEVSDPVRTRFGLHLIKLEDKRPAGVKSLAEVKETIRSWLAEDKAADNLEDTLDLALEKILSTGDLEQAASDLGLSLTKSEPFSKKAGPKDLKLGKKPLEELFAMQPGEITDRPIFLDTGYLLAHKTEARPSRISPLETVRETIRSQLQKQKGLEMAREKAGGVLQRLRKNNQELAGYEPKQSEPFNRRGFIPGLGMNPELAEAALSARDQQWLPKAYKVSQGYLLARPTTTIPPKSSQWQEQKSYWIAQLNNQRKQGLYQAFLQGVRARAEIRIITPELLSY